MATPMNGFEDELKAIKPELTEQAVALYEKLGLTPMQMYEKCCEIESKARMISDICSTFNH